MRNQFKLAFSMDSTEVRSYKIPIAAGIFLVYISSVFFQHKDNFSIEDASGFTIVMALQLILYLFSDTLFKRRYWLYFVIQGIITFDYAVISPTGYETILIGLIPVLIFQSILVYYDAMKVILTSIFFYSIFCGTILIYDGVKDLIRYIPILMLITIAVRVYSTIFLRQVTMRIQTQKVLHELEFAYEKVEELTLINERHRMARDLHDTLSQGLAGTIMQLDAVNANLNNNNVKRAQEIVQRAMEHARKTLSDSRLVIDDLRSQAKENMDFTTAIENEIAQFKAISSTVISADIKINSQLPSKIYKHGLYIVREGLNNIAKHAKAKNAVVEIIESNNEININIIDDGIGFDVKLLDRLFGHYGILGMTERAKTLKGRLKIKSRKKYGTTVNIVIPIVKGIDEENE